jgi:hypothetical protein
VARFDKIRQVVFGSEVNPAEGSRQVPTATPSRNPTMQIPAISGGSGYPSLSTAAPTSLGTAPPVVPEGEDSGKKTPAGDTLDIKRGVIRNLLSGHYKGVADVRLRINFHDELQALTTPPPTGEEPDVEPIGDPASGSAVSEEVISAEPVAGGAPEGGLVLPELSPPNGKGKAYAKFLTIYEELMQGTEAPGESESSEEAAASVDVTA